MLWGGVALSYLSRMESLSTPQQIYVHDPDGFSISGQLKKHLSGGMQAGRSRWEHSYFHAGSARILELELPAHPPRPLLTNQLKLFAP